MYHFDIKCSKSCFSWRIILVGKDILRSCLTLLLKQGQLVQVSKDEVSSLEDCFLDVHSLACTSAYSD